MSAISLSAFQNASSRLTLELRPLNVTYLLTIVDLRRASPDSEILSIAGRLTAAPACRQLTKRYRLGWFCFPLLRPPGSHRVAFFDGAFGGSARVSLGAIVVEHEKADHRGKVIMFAIDVDG